MSGAAPPLPNTPSWRGAQLNHRDKFTLTLPEKSSIVGAQTLLQLLVLASETSVTFQDRYVVCAENVNSESSHVRIIHYSSSVYE
jgi:hypothetical protein